MVVVKESPLCADHLVLNFTIRAETTKVLCAEIIKLSAQFFFLFSSYEFS